MNPDQGSVGDILQKVSGQGVVGVLFREEVSGAEGCRGTYREEISGTHGKELDEGLHGEDGGEEVVAVQQQRVEKRRPEVQDIKLNSAKIYRFLQLFFARV